MINQAIGASGVASQQCKAEIQQYRQTIMDLLLAEAHSKKVCSQVEVCTFNGTHGVSRADQQDCTMICALLVKLQSYGWRIN